MSGEPVEGAAWRAQAAIFDFNGTISDDEPLLEGLFADALASLGATLTTEVYYERLAGLSDPEIVRTALELFGIDSTRRLRERVLREKIDRYKLAVSAKPAISERAAEFVRATARRVPVAIASGAVREEVEHGLRLAGLLEAFGAVVCIEDVRRGKPDPEGYELALARLNEGRAHGAELRAARTLVFEDADAGVRAAKAAGMRCVALATPAYTGAPVAADRVIERLDARMLEELLGGGWAA